MWGFGDKETLKISKMGKLIVYAVNEEMMSRLKTEIQNSNSIICSTEEEITKIAGQTIFEAKQKAFDNACKKLQNADKYSSATTYMTKERYESLIKPIYYGIGARFE
jgi:hypothetical protein